MKLENLKKSELVDIIETLAEQNVLLEDFIQRRQERVQLGAYTVPFGERIWATAGAAKHILDSKTTLPMDVVHTLRWMATGFSFVDVKGTTIKDQVKAARAAAKERAEALKAQARAQAVAEEIVTEVIQ